MRIERLREVDSTNLKIKEYIPYGEDIVLWADRQTAGMGTKGRSFLSREGGVYLSFLTFYSGLKAADAFLIMAHAALSVCRTVEEFGAVPSIKWPNDVFVEGKKICGILIENDIRAGDIDHSIVGIGLNVSNRLDGIGGIAITLSQACGRPLPAEEVGKRLIENYGRESSFSEYLAYIRFLGKQISVVENGDTYPATAVRVLEDGRLEIRTKEGIRRLSGAEITIKL